MTLKTTTLYVEITHDYKKLIFATVYRPPKLQPTDEIALYNEMPSLIQGKNSIVIGDFNCANVDCFIFSYLRVAEDYPHVVQSPEDHPSTRTLEELAQ